MSCDVDKACWFIVANYCKVIRFTEEAFVGPSCSKRLNMAEREELSKLEELAMNISDSDEEGDSAARTRPAVSPSPEPLAPGSEEEDLPPRASTPRPEDYRSSSSDDLPFEVISSPTPPAPAPPSVTEEREPAQKTPEPESEAPAVEDE